MVLAEVLCLAPSGARPIGLEAAEQGGSGTLLTGVLVLLGLYLLASWVWPYTSCGRCDGAGKFRSPGGKSFRRCPRCGGSGERLRWGARMFGRRE